MAIDFTVVQMGAIVFSINTGEVLLNYGIERIFCTIMSKTILLIVVYLMHEYNRNKTQISGRHLGICGLIAWILVALDYYIAENSMMAVNDKMRMFLGIYFISSIVIMIIKNLINTIYYKESFCPGPVARIVLDGGGRDAGRRAERRSQRAFLFPYSRFLPQEPFHAATFFGTDRQGEGHAPDSGVRGERGQ